MAVVLMAFPSAGFARDRSKPPAPTANPASWFPVDRYPAEAKRAGQQGRVTVQITVDKTGMPTACQVLTSSGVASLDTATCDLAIANARFVPAKDKNGQPVESTFTTPGVRWVLFNEPPIKLEAPWRVSATLLIDTAGQLSSCKEQRSGPAPEREQLCVGAKAMPPAFGMFARGGSTAPLTELVIEMSQSFDDAPGLPMTFESEGRETLKMGVVHFDVDIAGTVSNCRVEAQSGPGPADLCQPPPRPYQPIEKPRGVTVKFAMSRPGVR